MLSELTSRQFAEWMAFDKLEPWGEERADLRMGIVASTIANVNRSAKNNHAYKPSEFMPSFELEEDEEVAAARLLARAKAALGGF